MPDELKNIDELGFKIRHARARVSMYCEQCLETKRCDFFCNADGGDPKLYCSYCGFRVETSALVMAILGARVQTGELQPPPTIRPFGALTTESSFGRAYASRVDVDGRRVLDIV